jgi:hypothetical protein
MGHPTCRHSNDSAGKKIQVFLLLLFEKTIKSISIHQEVMHIPADKKKAVHPARKRP